MAEAAQSSLHTMATDKHLKRYFQLEYVGFGKKPEEMLTVALGINGVTLCRNTHVKISIVSGDQNAYELLKLAFEPYQPHWLVTEINFVDQI